MGFAGVYTALYSYEPQAEGELEIKEGELLYILDKTGDDAWWKAKKKAADDDEEEPVGLIPDNYVEEANPVASAKALYEYSRQTDEEVSFSDDAHIDVYDTSDPDWTLVGVDGDFGFAPSNYIEIGDSEDAPRSPSVAEAPPQHPTPSSPAAAGPAAALARALGGQSRAPEGNTRSIVSPPDTPSLPPRPQHTPEEDEPEEEAPALPRRPPSQSIASPAQAYPSPREEPSGGIQASPPYNRAVHHDDGANGLQSPGGYHMYNINEMVSAMGKRKKLPVTLGINMATGKIMLSPEKSRDGPTNEWTADQLTHYSIEGKHVFMELVRPSKSLDLHGGSKETAQEIVSALGELAGAVRGEGIREVIAAATGGPSQKQGQMLYEFMAQGDDEVTVAVGDEVIVLDDKNEEWWLVRRLKNGKEGVVPSSYVEVTGSIPVASSSHTGINAGLSTIEQNRLEETRLAKEAARADRMRKDNEAKNEVGPGMTLPDRGSSLSPNKISQRSKRDRDGKSSKPKPDPSRTRTWTDRSNTFRVEAQFIGLTDGKIHLHKVNGVKIAVPISKMSPEDVEYVEQQSGVSLDEDKPLSDIRRRSRNEQSNGHAGAFIDRPKQSDYDWFDFFLKAGVGPHQCERYSQNFNRDQMDEAILPDITPETLRSLGLKEGDILRVMKHLDGKFGRTGGSSKLRSVSFAEGGADGDANGGLFTGPGGTLRNNTSKGRPRPTTQAGDVVDPKAFEQADTSPKPAAPQETRQTPLASAPPPAPERVQTGFDDDAWEVKRPQQAAAAAPPPAAAPRPAPPPATASTSATAPPSAPQQNPLLTGALAELSLLTPPLQPSQAPQPQAPPMIPQPPHTPASQQSAPPMQSQATGANPAFFSQLNPQQTGLPQQSFGQGQMPSQQTGFSQPAPPRQRPQPPQNQATSSLIAPPPRPLSAPQNFQQQNQFGVQPLQPQLTGVPQASLQMYGQQQMQPQPTGFQQQQQQGMGLPYGNGMMPQQTGFGQQQQQPLGFQSNQYMTGNQQGSPFADPSRGFSPVSAQQTGYGGFQQQQPMQTGINSVLPPAMQPQQTGFQPQLQPQQTGFQPQMQPQPTGFQSQPTGFQQQLQPQATGMNGFGNQSFGQSQSPIPPMPPMPQQHTMAPLQVQKTGAPPIRFGVSEPKKLAPQPTGRRANLAQATPDNPFGF